MVRADKHDPNSPPTWLFNSVATGPTGNIYVTGDVSNILYRITPARSGDGGL